MPLDDNSQPVPWILMDWHVACEAAWRETDRVLLFKLVEAAEAAVLIRREALASGENHHAERRAIEDALTRLRILKAEKLSFRQPESQSNSSQKPASLE